MQTTAKRTEDRRQSVERGKHHALAPSPTLNSSTGITLLELMVVVAVIGLVTAISLPALKGIGQANTIASASRQLIDDIGLARQMAINNRSVVYMLFMGGVLDYGQYATLTPAYLSTNLLKRQYISYTLFAERTLGDQPGQATSRYLTSWRTLPEGIFITPRKFTSGREDIPLLKREALAFEFEKFPYPRGDSSTVVYFYYIKFDPSGRVISRQSADGLVVIPLCRGSIFLEQNAGGGYTWAQAAPFERPLNNWKDNPSLVVIDGPTGRARLERLEMQ